MKTILICDDEHRSREKWKRELKAVVRHVGASFTVDSISDSKELLDSIAELEVRRHNARRHSNTSTIRNANRFDTADILIVDYDLLKLNEGGSGYLTGEGVAYLCRCYSHCGLIIALNQYGNNYFDLTLKGHPESYADLNIGSAQLMNQGLWTEDWSGFRPWYWPLLPSACDAFERRWKQLQDHLQEPVLSYLGFSMKTIKTLPRSTREFLGRGSEPEKTTFATFVTDSGSGLRPKDKVGDNESVARIAAARLGKWLER